MVSHTWGRGRGLFGGRRGWGGRRQVGRVVHCSSRWCRRPAVVAVLPVAVGGVAVLAVLLAVGGPVVLWLPAVCHVCLLDLSWKENVPQSGNRKVCSRTVGSDLERWVQFVESAARDRRDAGGCCCCCRLKLLSGSDTNTPVCVCVCVWSRSHNESCPGAPDVPPSPHSQLP